MTAYVVEDINIMEVDMTDEFNLVPTNNLEKHLDNILRAASGEEPQYDLAPNWRTEQYLAAIAAKLSGGGSGGGAEPLILNITNTPVSGGTKYELDKTAGEIYTAFMSGSQIFLLASSSNNDDSLYPVWTLKVKNGYVSVLSINPSVINANFTAYNATVKPFYTTSTSGGSND